MDDTKTYPSFYRAFFLLKLADFETQELNDHDETSSLSRIVQSKIPFKKSLLPYPIVVPSGPRDEESSAGQSSRQLSPSQCSEKGPILKRLFKNDCSFREREDSILQQDSKRLVLRCKPPRLPIAHHRIDHGELCHPRLTRSNTTRRFHL